MEYRDIYSKYPELATRLVRTSSQMNIISTLGNCNLDLSNKEIIKILDIKPYAKKAMFKLYNEGSGDGPGLYFEAIMFIKQFTVDENYHYWLYDAECSTTGEVHSYHVLEIPLNGNNRSNIDLKDSLLNMDDINIKYLDVRSLYLLYNNRKSCRKIPNYAKYKTIEIFNAMIDRFNTYDNILILNLYVLINALVLDLDVSTDFMNNQQRFSTDGDYDYDDYINNTDDERDEIIEDIRFAIRNF